jgi:copper oxidase (laccase) domain-containing protein
VEAAEHRKFIDLVDVNRMQLEQAGVPESNFDISGLCTFCGTENFHSWRRDREASGRMVAVIGIQHR